MPRSARAAPALTLLLLAGLARGEEVRGTLLERGGELQLGPRTLAGDGDPRLLARLRAWIGREVALEGAARPDGRLQVARVLAPRPVRREGWIARDPAGGGPLLWCSEGEVWRCFGPALAALREARGRRATVEGWAFEAGGAPEALCAEGLAPGPERAEVATARGVVAPGEGPGALLLRPAQGPPWRLLCAAGEASPAPWLARLCGREVALEGLALPAPPDAPARPLLVERAASVEAVTPSGRLGAEGLETSSGLLPLAPPCLAHGGDDPRPLLAHLRGREVQLQGLLLRGAEGAPRELVPQGALALDDAGRVVLVTRLGADGRAEGTLGAEPAAWPLERLRFAPEAPAPRKIPGH